MERNGPLLKHLLKAKVTINCIIQTMLHNIKDSYHPGLFIEKMKAVYIFYKQIQQTHGEIKLTVV